VFEIVYTMIVFIFVLNCMNHDDSAISPIGDRAKGGKGGWGEEADLS